jgi:CelD/BcsL family acetyltransferase involved in cellulose biosynthesis
MHTRQERLRVDILGEQDLAEWDRFVDTAPQSTVYHTSGWGRAVSRIYPCVPQYFVVRSPDSGAIRAGMAVHRVGRRPLPRRIAAVPCAPYGGVLAEREDDADALLNAVLAYGARIGVPRFELRSVGPASAPCLESASKTETYSTYVLDLRPSLDDLEGGLHKSSIRRHIRKCARQGIEIREGKDLSDVRSFYHLYLAMRKGDGLLPQSLAFFSSVWKTLRPGRVGILHAIYDGRVVSSLLLLHHHTTTYYAYGATEEGMLRMGVSPYLLWSAATRAREAGHTTFDFGRTNEADEGLNRFKQRWNAVRVPLVYYYLPNIPRTQAIRNQRGTKHLMDLVVRSSPDGVCRLLGRMCYPYLI